jgi:hypothetical protein
MAEFCHECSIEVFGEDFEELARLVEKGCKVAVICEDCGITFVDHQGVCVSDCDKQHYDKRVKEGYWAEGGIVNSTSKTPRELERNPTSES